MFRFICIAFASAFCFSCDGAPEEKEADKTPVEEEQHQLTGIEAFLLNTNYRFDSSDAFSPLEGTDVHIGFELNDRGGLDLVLSGGCNELRGWATFDTQATMLIDSFSGMTQTCDWEIMTQDDWLMSFFSNAPSLLMLGEGYFEMTGEEAVLLFLAVESPSSN